MTSLLYFGYASYNTKVAIDWVRLVRNEGDNSIIIAVLS